MAASREERATLLPPAEENAGADALEATAHNHRQLGGSEPDAESLRDEREFGECDAHGGAPRDERWRVSRLASAAAVAALALATVIVLANTDAWRGLRGGATAAAALGGGVALEVEPVGHVIWLGSKLPNVKRVFLHRNQELLHEAGWKLKLWCVRRARDASYRLRLNPNPEP
jgi:hypothetical protein